MSELTNKKIKDTYQGVVHLEGNSTISNSKQELQDGNGNNIGIQVQVNSEGQPIVSIPSLSGGPNPISDNILTAVRTQKDIYSPNENINILWKVYGTQDEGVYKVFTQNVNTPNQGWVFQKDFPHTGSQDYSVILSPSIPLAPSEYIVGVKTAGNNTDFDIDGDTVSDFMIIKGFDVTFTTSPVILGANSTVVYGNAYGIEKVKVKIFDIADSGVVTTISSEDIEVVDFAFSFDYNFPSEVYLNSIGHSYKIVVEDYLDPSINKTSDPLVLLGYIHIGDVYAIDHPQSRIENGELVAVNWSLHAEAPQQPGAGGSTPPPPPTATLTLYQKNTLSTGEEWINPVIISGNINISQISGVYNFLLSVDDALIDPARNNSTLPLNNFLLKLERNDNGLFHKKIISVYARTGATTGLKILDYPSGFKIGEPFNIKCKVDNTGIAHPITNIDIHLWKYVGDEYLLVHEISNKVPISDGIHDIEINIGYAFQTQTGRSNFSPDNKYKLYLYAYDSSFIQVNHNGVDIIATTGDMRGKYLYALESNDNNTLEYSMQIPKKDDALSFKAKKASFKVTGIEDITTPALSVYFFPDYYNNRDVYLFLSPEKDPVTKLKGYTRKINAKENSITLDFKSLNIYKKVDDSDDFFKDVIFPQRNAYIVIASEGDNDIVPLFSPIKIDYYGTFLSTEEDIIFPSGTGNGSYATPIEVEQKFEGSILGDGTVTYVEGLNLGAIPSIDAYYRKRKLPSESKLKTVENIFCSIHTKTNGKIIKKTIREIPDTLFQESMEGEYDSLSNMSLSVQDIFGGIMKYREYIKDLLDDNIVSFQIRISDEPKNIPDYDNFLVKKGYYGYFSINVTLVATQFRP